MRYKSPQLLYHKVFPMHGIDMIDSPFSTVNDAWLAMNEITHREAILLGSRIDFW